MLALALGGLPSGVHADETWREQSRRVEPAAGLERLVVDNARGKVEVRPSQDGSLHITALKIARGGTEAEAERSARGVTVELQREGHRYFVRVRYPRNESIHVSLWENFDLSRPRLEVQLSLDVPPTMALELSASSGDLFTQDMHGEQRLRASSGNVTVEGARGPLDVSTSSGDVSLADARLAKVATSSGDVEATGAPAVLAIETSSGDVSVEGASDSLRVGTTSGDVSIDHAPRGATVTTSSGEVRVRSAAGRLLVTSVSGEIRAHVTAALSEATLRSSSGDIRLGLDPQVGCALEMGTSSGSLDLDVPVRTETLTRHRVTGVVRNGTAPVRLHSVSGGIAVVSGEP